MQPTGQRNNRVVAELHSIKANIKAGESAEINGAVMVRNPKLWGPPPTQNPNLYEAVVTVSIEGKTVDSYVTSFGIRSIDFDPNQGILVNNELIKIKGVNQHHDLGALGVAFNTRAAERHWNCYGRWAATPFAWPIILRRRNCLISPTVWDFW